MTKYVLHKQLNSGGMGTLWLASREGLDGFRKPCAIKCLNADTFSSHESEEMLASEAKIYSYLQHANIIAVSDFTVIQNQLSIVMELVVGGDLSRIFEYSMKTGAQIPIPMLLFVCSEIAKGLHYAHEIRDPISGTPLGIVHRDVSPSNILISDFGSVKLTDFGLAKSSLAGKETRAGQVKGKYSYMSPEQIQGKQAHRSMDIFSLGVVLWEGLAGKPRFANIAEPEMLSQIAVGGGFTDLTTLNDNVDSELNQIVFKSLQTNPMHRYATAAEFAQTLERYQHAHFANFTPSKLATFVKRMVADDIELLYDYLGRALGDSNRPNRPMSSNNLKAIEKPAESLNSINKSMPNISAISLKSNDKEQGQISDVEKLADGSLKITIQVSDQHKGAESKSASTTFKGKDLTFVDNTPALPNLDRVSKPSLRTYPDGNARSKTTIGVYQTRPPTRFQNPPEQDKTWQLVLFVVAVAAIILSIAYFGPNRTELLSKLRSLR